MKIQCILDRVKYQQKPNSEKIGEYVCEKTGEIRSYSEIMLLNSRMKKLRNESFNFQEWVKLKEQGCTDVMATFKTNEKGIILGRKSQYVESKKIIVLDCDEFLSIDECIERFKYLNIDIMFLYKSFSHSEEKNKYRVGIALKYRITDMKLYKELYEDFMELVVEGTGKQLDTAVKDPARIFFGSKEKFVIANENAEPFCPVKYGLEGWNFTRSLSDGARKNRKILKDTVYCKKIKTLKKENEVFLGKITLDSQIYKKSFLLKAFIDGGLEYENFIKANQSCLEVGRMRYKHLILVRIFMYYHGLIEEFEARAYEIHPEVDWKMQRNSDLNRGLEQKYREKWGDLHERENP